MIGLIERQNEALPALRAAHLREPQALIIGARSFDPALMPRRSRVGNHISTFFISLFAGQRFRDTQSGFRVYPAQLLRRAPLRACRFEIETELLLWGSKLGVPVVEVPIATIYAPPLAADAAPVHRTHFRNVHDTLRILRLVIGSPLWRAPQPPSLSPSPGAGSTSASTTRMAEMSFMSFGLRPTWSASWITTR